MRFHMFSVPQLEHQERIKYVAMKRCVVLIHAGKEILDEVLPNIPSLAASRIAQYVLGQPADLRVTFQPRTHR